MNDLKLKRRMKSLFKNKLYYLFNKNDYLSKKKKKVFFKKSNFVA